MGEISLLFGLLWILIVILIGIYMYVKPDVVARKIKVFYSNYPLVHYAGEKQLTSRPIFIKILGIVFVLGGMIIFLGTIFLSLR